MVAGVKPRRIGSSVRHRVLGMLGTVTKSDELLTCVKTPEGQKLRWKTREVISSGRFIQPTEATERDSEDMPYWELVELACQTSGLSRDELARRALATGLSMREACGAFLCASKV